MELNNFAAMTDLSELPWSQLTRVSTEKINQWLSCVKESKIHDNLTLRFYIVSFDNGKLNEAGFINFLLDTVKGFVFDQTEIDEIIDDGEEPFQAALKYFGDVDPIRDGRYGELILYILTEGILNVPLIVHKIAHSYSPNKQIEGSDGLFFGLHNAKLSLLLGEAKMRNKFNVCLPDAISSIDRFHDNPDALKHEIKVARKHLSKDIDTLDHKALTALYNSLKNTNQEGAAHEMSHPILLVFNDKKLSDPACSSVETAIQEIESSLQKKENSIVTQSDHLKPFVLDFFLIPVEDVSDFRLRLYKAFHGGKDYKKKTDG